MWKLYILLAFLLVCLSSCKTEFEDFQDHALKLGAGGRLGKESFYMLLDEIGRGKDNSFKKMFYDHNRLDTLKVANYLSKLYATKDLKIPAQLIYTGSGHGLENTPQGSKFNINVYLENSASIDGYVSGHTEFKDALYSFLGDIKLSEYCDSLNLNYINRTIPFSKLNADASGINDFIQTLTPASFKKRGGVRSSSDIMQILGNVLNRTNSSNMSVVVSDFVFSPGLRQNASNYLAQESIGIKANFANKLKQFDLSVMVIQLMSSFDGFYYDETDKPFRLSSRRPYYVWLMGSERQLKAIIKSGVIENIRGGYQNRLLLQKVHQTSTPDYKILYTEKIGSFHLPSGARGPIENATASNQLRTMNKFAFNVAVDYSESLLDPSYFSDTGNYSHNKNYAIAAKQIGLTADPSLSNFTHLIRLTTAEPRPETITIAIRGRMPQWIKDSSSENDTQLTTNLQEQKKTFGLNYLIEGVYNAFYQAPGNDTISSFDIIIK